jgi:alkanesulfonate monooxygenase SsuD/methylene tetrahydromethanopterin reductase-like flavin-dependent oxidoreductase (luciferase family)
MSENAAFGVHLGMPCVGDQSLDRLTYYERLLAAGEGALSALWVSDHLQNDDADVLEGWTTLTYLGARAPSYRVGHLVLSQSYRNPALLAKMAATLQTLTGGRFVLGLGAGWQEDEYRAYDFPFPSARVRIEQLGETIDLMRAMWTDSPATYAGAHYRVTDAYCEPRPEPIPPILIGGQGPRLMRGTGTRRSSCTGRRTSGSSQAAPRSAATSRRSDSSRGSRCIFRAIAPTSRTRYGAVTWTS